MTLSRAGGWRTSTTFIDKFHRRRNCVPLSFCSVAIVIFFLRSCGCFYATNDLNMVLLINTNDTKLARANGCESGSNGGGNCGGGDGKVWTTGNFINQLCCIKKAPMWESELTVWLTTLSNEDSGIGSGQAADLSIDWLTNAPRRLLAGQWQW